jgi:predicted N-acetyltransferase YhbS
MKWSISRDIDDYVRNALPLLEADPARNTTALTVLDQLRAGQQFSSTPPLFGWCTQSEDVVGAIFMTPPYDLGLAVVPLAAIDSLVAVLGAHEVAVPGVIGDVEVCGAFLARWPATPPGSQIGEQRQRLYRLEKLVAPDPAPAGGARRATEADFELLVAWIRAFSAEAGTRSGERDAEVVRRRIRLGLTWVWETAGEVVSMASRNVTAVGVARIGPVYTPPEERRQGYGAAVTAACTADALATDAEGAVLFTDLANPTSNAIYQTIGFRPVCDRVAVRFR